MRNLLVLLLTIFNINIAICHITIKEGSQDDATFSTRNASHSDIDNKIARKEELHAHNPPLLTWRTNKAYNPEYATIVDQIKAITRAKFQNGTLVPQYTGVNIGRRKNVTYSPATYESPQGSRNPQDDRSLLSDDNDDRNVVVNEENSSRSNSRGGTSVFIRDPKLDHEGHAHETGDRPTGLSSYGYLHVDTDTLRRMTPPDVGPRIKDFNSEEFELCQICACVNYTRVVCEYNRIYGQRVTSSLTLSSHTIPHAALYLQVRGFHKVEIMPETFFNNETNLLWISIENVRQLVLHKHSFLLSPNASLNYELTIQLINCGIPLFPTETLSQWIEGRHVRSDKTKLEKTRFVSLELKRCEIEFMDHSALTSTRLIFFNITETTIKEMEHHAIDLDVYEMAVFKKSSFFDLSPNEAICLHARKVVFIQNTFKQLARGTLNIETSGQVLFDSNYIETLGSYALANIEPLENTYGANLVFLANNIVDAEPNSLYINPAFPAHERKLLNNTFDISCQCNISGTILKALVGKEMVMNDEDEILARGLGEFFHPGDHRRKYSHTLENSKCRDTNMDRFTLVDIYINTNCKPFPAVTVGAIAAAIFLFIVAVSLAVICSVKLKKVQNEMNSLGECTSQSFSTLSKPYHGYHRGSEGDFDSTYTRPCESGTILTTAQCSFDSPPTSPYGKHTLNYPWVAAVPEMKVYHQHELPAFTERAESIRGSVRGTLPQGVIQPFTIANTMDDETETKNFSYSGKKRSMKIEDLKEKEKKELARSSCPFN